MDGRLLTASSAPLLRRQRHRTVSADLLRYTAVVQHACEPGCSLHQEPVALRPARHVEATLAAWVHTEDLTLRLSFLQARGVLAALHGLALGRVWAVRVGAVHAVLPVRLGDQPELFRQHRVDRDVRIARPVDALDADATVVVQLGLRTRESRPVSVPSPKGARSAQPRTLSLRLTPLPPALPLCPALAAAPCAPALGGLLIL